MTETVIVATVSALFGFLGGLIPSISSALKSRAESRLAAKQTDLDHLRAIIDELQEELVRRKAQQQEEQAEREKLEKRIVVLEADCGRKDKRIGELEAKLAHLTAERADLEARIASLVAYIDLLTKTMRAHNIPVPERKPTRPLES